MDDVEHMRRAMALAAAVRSAHRAESLGGLRDRARRAAASDAAGDAFEGATAPPGRARTPRWPRWPRPVRRRRGATLYVTLEPCAHHGRTPPCTDAIVAAGVARVVIGVEDPDPGWRGGGVAALRDGRDRGDGGRGGRRGRRAAGARTSSTAPPGSPGWSSRWRPASTPAPPPPTAPAAGSPARRPVATRTCLRARSDAVLVGAGTVRADDPELTVRLDDGLEHPQPLRVVLGHGARRAPGCTRRSSSRATWATCWPSWAGAACSSCWSRAGPSVAHDFHAAGLVDRYVLYLAPMFFGGDDARPLFAGPGAGTIGDVWKGRLVSIEQLGEDLRVEVAA